MLLEGGVRPQIRHAQPGEGTQRRATFSREDAEGVPTPEAAGAAEGVYRARTTPGTPTLGASLPDAARDWTHLETLLALGAAGAGRETGVETGVETGAGSNPRATLLDPTLDSPGSIAASRRRFVLGWDARRDAPAALLDARATPDDVIAAALAAVHAAETRNSRNRGCDVGGGDGRGDRGGGVRVRGSTRGRIRGGDASGGLANGFRPDGHGAEVQAGRAGKRGEEGRVKETDE